MEIKDMEKEMKMPEFGTAGPPARRFGMKEMVLGGVVVTLFILFAAFAGVYGKTSNEVANLKPQAQKGDKLDQTCFTKACLEAAAYTLVNMNLSADPCNNFYNYACGNYKLFRKLDPSTNQITLFTEMNKRIKNKLRTILESPVKNVDWEAEKKLKELFQACNDDYQLEKLKGTPIINQFLNKMKGWYVLATWDQSTYNLNGMLKTVQADFAVNALFGMGVYSDPYNPTKTSIQFRPAGTGRYMRWAYYTNTRYQSIRDAYKKFMRRIANLIVRDAGVTLTPAAQTEKINTFVNDVFSIETKLANLSLTSPWNIGAYDDSKQITLDELTRQTQTVIQYTQQATYYFENSNIGGDKKTIVFNLNYMKGVSKMINDLPSGDAARQMHNYMVWRVLEQYVMDMSWEYVHANREIYTAVTGRTDFSGKWNYCFNYVSRSMPEALGALFIADHFADQNKEKVVDITENIKKALVNMLWKTSWMDDETKNLAEAKIAKAEYRLGYPDFLADTTKVDKFYNSLTIDQTDFFGNVLRLNEFQRLEWNRELKNGEDIAQWYFKTWDVNMAVLWYRNQIIVPAGLLQFPIYDFHFPHYFSFGAIGSFMGHFILHLADKSGSSWDNDGKYLGYKKYWWTNGTITAYNRTKLCMVDAFNKTQSPFTAPDGSQVSIPIMSERTVRENIAKTSGLKMAFDAYHLWENAKGFEKLTPTGQDLTNDQLFFIAYAQTHCVNRNDRYSYIYAKYYGRTREDYQINLVLSQLPEFSKAFSCPVDAKLNPPNKCNLY